MNELNALLDVDKKDDVELFGNEAADVGDDSEVRSSDRDAR